MHQVRLIIIGISCLLIGFFMLANRQVPDRHVFEDGANAGTTTTPVPTTTPLPVRSGTVDQAVGEATPSPSSNPTATTSGKRHKHHDSD